jgi:hypothetical protein
MTGIFVLIWVPSSSERGHNHVGSSLESIEEDQIPPIFNGTIDLG